MSQHTPGTWAVGVYEATDNFRSITQHACICDHDTLALIAVTGPATDKQSQADARLMAAAPDLLAALEAVLQGFEHGDFRRTHPRQADSDPYHPALVAANAAIRKATEEE